MALIECPDCRTSVSDQATACVKCGRPLAAIATEPAPTVAVGTTTIQATGKEWKALELGGVVLVLVGTGSCAAGKTDASALCWLFGLLAYIGGRFGAWWNHG